MSTKTKLKLFAEGMSGGVCLSLLLIGLVHTVAHVLPED